MKNEEKKNEEPIGSPVSDKEKETTELDIDQSLLSDEEKKEMGYHFPWFWLIICGVIVILMIVCIIVIINI